MKGLHLIAQLLRIIQGILRLGIRGLCGTKSALRLAQMIGKLLQLRCDLRFGSGVGSVALAEPIGLALDLCFDICLIHIAQRIAQLGSGAGLRGRELASGIAHLLLKPGETVGEFLPLISERLHLLIGLRGSLRSRETIQAISLRLLFRLQLLRFASHGTDAAGSLLALQCAESVRGLA